MQTTHALVHIGISVPDAKTLPVLVDLMDPDAPKISWLVAKYARYHQRQGFMSYESIKKAVAVLGKLRDYFVLIAKADAENTRSLIEDFLYAYDHGTVLGWRPVSNQLYFCARRVVNEFLRWLESFSLQERMYEDEYLTFSTYKEAYAYTKQIEHSLLFHTKTRVKKKAAGRKRVIVGLRNFKAFPQELVIPLLQQTSNIRDRLFFGMMACGGRRPSEYLHLFVSDISAHEGELHVRLAHPSEAPLSWKNRSGATISSTRAAYLRSMHNLLPRNELGAHPLAAGWKGMKYDDALGMNSECYWIRDIAPYLLVLHQQYVCEGRHDNRKHPYYFTNLDGEPLKLSAIDKQFSLAKNRLEKLYGIDLSGYGLRSLRHSYGFYCANVLRLELMVIQKMMGHVDPSATAIYASIEASTIHSMLRDADDLAKIEGRINCSVEEQDALEERRRQISLGPIPEDWRKSSIAYGTMDVTYMRRGRDSS